jgi:hypothetical protein
LGCLHLDNASAGKAKAVSSADASEEVSTYFALMTYLHLVDYTSNSLLEKGAGE